MKEFFNKAFDVMYNFFTSSKMKTFYWQTADSFLVILTGTLMLIKPDDVSGITLLIISACVAGLQRLTKWINVTYLKK